MGDNEHVKAGQVLARIDDRDFKVALDQAKADVAAAGATIASKQAQLDVQQAVIIGGEGHPRCRPGRGDLRRAGQQALHRSRRDAARQRAERAAGAGADRRARRPRWRATTPISLSALKQVDLLKAELAQAKAAPGARRGGAAPGRAQPRLHHDHRADRRRRRQPHAARRPICAGRHAIDVGGAGRRRLCRRELQGNAAHRRACRPGRSISRSTCSRARSCTAMSTASRRPAARNSRCCRRTTPPAISPRSCSASR